MGEETPRGTQGTQKKSGKKGGASKGPNRGQQQTKAGGLIEHKQKNSDKKQRETQVPVKT